MNRTLTSALASSALLLACKSQSAVTTAPATDARAYSVDTEMEACAHNADCTFRIRLTALGTYHVNPDYPHRFLADNDAGAEFTAFGELAREGEKRGTLTVHYRVANAGPQKITGTFKLSVCNADQCKIEEAPIAFDVGVQ